MGFKVHGLLMFSVMGVMVEGSRVYKGSEVKGLGFRIF